MNLAVPFLGNYQGRRSVVYCWMGNSVAATHSQAWFGASQAIVFSLLHALLFHHPRFACYFRCVWVIIIDFHMWVFNALPVGVSAKGSSVTVQTNKYNHAKSSADFSTTVANSIVGFLQRPACSVTFLKMCGSERKLSNLCSLFDQQVEIVQRDEWKQGFLVTKTMIKEVTRSNFNAKPFTNCKFRPLLPKAGTWSQSGF